MQAVITGSMLLFDGPPVQADLYGLDNAAMFLFVAIAAQ
jgi:hypothetical protein